MVTRHAVAFLTLLSFSPALAENLDAEAARQFIVGKLFAFTCGDGSRGAARVYDDGSVIGTVQFHGSEQPRPIWLPTETLKFTGEAVCASLNRTELCFGLSKTSEQSFRAFVTGLDFAYCDFTERVRTGPEPSEPLSLGQQRDEDGPVARCLVPDEYLGNRGSHGAKRVTSRDDLMWRRHP
jgi:hypothetical protein